MSIFMILLCHKNVLCKPSHEGHFPVITSFHYDLKFVFQKKAVSWKMEGDGAILRKYCVYQGSLEKLIHLVTDNNVMYFLWVFQQYVIKWKPLSRLNTLKLKTHGYSIELVLIFMRRYKVMDFLWGFLTIQKLMIKKINQ